MATELNRDNISYVTKSMFSKHRSFLGHWSLMFGGYGTSIRVIKDDIASNYFSDTTKHTSQDVPTSYHGMCLNGHVANFWSIFDCSFCVAVIPTGYFSLRGVFIISRFIPRFCFTTRKCVEMQLCGGFHARSMTEWVKALGAYVEHLKAYDFILA